MQTIVTEALVLRSVEFGESDRILHVLTPATGRLTCIAKGARRSVRRFGGTLDFFNHLRVQIVRRSRGGMARLEHARLLGALESLRTRPRSFALGCFLLELLDRLAPEGGPPRDSARLFAFTLAALRLLDASEPDERMRTLLELRALDALGLCPELRRCVRCGEAIEVRGVAGFQVADGGPVCRPCGRSAPDLLPVQLGTLRALDQGLRLGLDRLDRLVLGARALDEARRVVERFQRFHVGIELRSEAFLDHVLAPERVGAA